MTNDDFLPTWKGIIAAGARDWVNLHAIGVRDDELLVAVEHFREPFNGRRFLHDDSVNLSGPKRE